MISYYLVYRNGREFPLPLKSLQILNSQNNVSYENCVNCANYANCESYANYVSYGNYGLRVD